MWAGGAGVWLGCLKIVLLGGRAVWRCYILKAVVVRAQWRAIDMRLHDPWGKETVAMPSWLVCACLQAM